MAARSDFTDALPNIDVPTLVICGQQDTISTVADMRGIAEAIPGARLVEVAGAAHVSPLEQPAAVNAAILRFLDLERGTCSK